MRIACVLAPFFEDSEYQKPRDAFEAAGHEVSVIGVDAGQDLSGYHQTAKAKTDEAFADVDPRDFDALFVPGGFSPDQLRADDAAVAFTRTFAEADKPIFAVCHGPQLLITSDAIRGRRLTAWRTVQEDLRRMRENVVDEEVVVDGNLVTSRQPDDLDAFVRESLALLDRVPTGAG